MKSKMLLSAFFAATLLPTFAETVVDVSVPSARRGKWLPVLSMLIIATIRRGMISARLTGVFMGEQRSCWSVCLKKKKI